MIIAGEARRFACANARGEVPPITGSTQARRCRHQGKKFGCGIYEYDEDGKAIAREGGSVTEYETLITSVEDSVGTITINRPDSRNSLNTQALGDIRSALEEFKYNIVWE